MAQGTKGRIVQVIGPVVDIEFPPERLPEIYNAVEIYRDGEESKLVLEVQQHVGDEWVRWVADPHLRPGGGESRIEVADRVVVMSPRPGRIAEVIDITTPRPRHLDDMSRPEVGEVLGHIRQHFSPTGALG